MIIHLYSSACGLSVFNLDYHLTYFKLGQVKYMFYRFPLVLPLHLLVLLLLIMVSLYPVFQNLLEFVMSLLQGFAELEYGMLRYMGAIDDSTPIVTSGK